jgi:hypothetical protein
MRMEMGAVYRDTSVAALSNTYPRLHVLISRGTAAHVLNIQYVILICRHLARDRTEMEKAYCGIDKGVPTRVTRCKLLSEFARIERGSYLRLRT